MVRIETILEYLKGEEVKYKFYGDKDMTISGFSSLNQHRAGCVSWLKELTSLPDGQDLSEISLLVCQEDINIFGQNTIVTPEAKRVFYSIAEKFFYKPVEHKPIGEFSYISPLVKLGNNVIIGHNCTLDGEITIGDNTIISNNVSILNKVKIGKNCVIQSGVVIGDEGYAYVEDLRHRKTMVRQFGGVSIGDDVLVGANTTIQNGAIDDTTIMDGCKISGNCFISHNSVIEEDSAIIVSDLHGSTHVGKNAYIVSSIVRNQATIGEGAFVGLGSVVTKNVDKNVTVIGVPAKPFSKEHK